jgi:plasmid maintenance system antidote protein VapI
MHRKCGRVLLREALKARGLTTRQAALLLDRTSGGIVHWCNGNRRPSRESALKLKRVFGIPLDAWDLADRAPATVAA